MQVKLWQRYLNPSISIGQNLGDLQACWIYASMYAIGDHLTKTLPHPLTVYIDKNKMICIPNLWWIVSNVTSTKEVILILNYYSGLLLIATWSNEAKVVKNIKNKVCPCW